MAIFTRDGDAFLPTAHAVGPWDPGQLHGGAPAALLAREIVALSPGMAVARLTYEFLGPVPVTPLLVAATITKSGRRFQQAEAELTGPDGRVLVRARAVLLRRGEVALPPVEEPGLPCAGPEALPAGRAFASGGDGFHLTGMELRDGGGTWSGEGAARTWFRLAHDLVDGEPEIAPAARAVAAADFGNGVAAALPFDGFLFVNTDLTVHLHREPEGAWVLLDATSRLERAGAGLAWSVLYDERGPFGLSAQTLYVDTR